MTQLSQDAIGVTRTPMDLPEFGTHRARPRVFHRASAGAAMTTARWVRRYRFGLLAMDTALVFAGILGTQLMLHPEVFTGRMLRPEQMAQALVVFAVWMALLALFRSRDRQILGVGSEEYKAVVNAGAAAIGATAVLFLAFQADSSRGYVFAGIPVATGALLVERWIARRWLTWHRKDGYFLSKVVVLGSHEDVEYVVARIAKKSGAVFKVVAAVVEDADVTGRLRVDDASIPVFSQVQNIPAVVARYGADAVIVAGQLAAGSSFIRELGWELEKSSTQLVVASSLTNVAGPRIRFRPVEGLPLMHVDLPNFTGSRHVLKRTMDIVLATLALLVLTIPMALIALLITRDSPGPALFRQVRVGRNGTSFTMLKFRSMVQTAEQDLAALREQNEGAGVLFKLKNDPRVTRIGGLLRRTSLDELPQIINVLRGDMSLVGPRPPLPSEVAAYHGHTHRRLFIKPGITGLWQVNGRSDLDWEESVRLDLYYVENWSLLGDLMIMWQTVKVMLNKNGAY
ncbi:exopolysaccharide biosynthesis polyprenyl glycosylphosphotransferase [Tersicoccus solisilvae]|uniref:Exopolysaccharide biosynthesis polyprenyl glycosylphosphotransferase n=1 Tax=Tersicoccus solisilvae TaxID=1882339 RepID=A0ABQ1PN77_9MICC|nr:sugar transferase [Tersicoccus solisilvae]GGD00053.1 exopolysaccharide biosynthesis polyprenyl glycosylphosphotransferase [Tersicoccus solisilvae]